MHRKTLIILTSLALIAFTAVPVFAVKPNGPSAENGLTKTNSDVMHLYLYEKDPTEWTVVEKGAWGKLTFNQTNFNFNGHKLLKDEEYAIIWYGAEEYNDEWPHATCIAKGFTNKGGNIHLSGEYGFAAFTDDEIPQKIWLVLAEDIDCDNNVMVDWQPEEYLFEYDTI
jgi:hypothetical protein